MANPYEVLGVASDATPTQIKAAYRRLANSHHPDRHANACAADRKKAEERFLDINTAYELLSSPEKRAHYDKYGHSEPIIIAHKRKQYQLVRLTASGELSDVYEAIDGGNRVALKIAKEPSVNDLLMQEAVVLERLTPENRPAHAKFHRFYPKLIDQFQIRTDGQSRQINVLEWLDYWWTLTSVRAAHPELRIEHAAWMFNRILGALSYAHWEHGIVHGAITPEHVLVFASPALKDPRNHGARLIDWSYSVKAGEKITVAVPQYWDMYPPEVIAKKPATFATDIYMAAKCIFYVLGGDLKTGTCPPHVPRYMESFLRGCMLANPKARPNDAVQLHAEFKAHLRKHYGPRRYVRFDMPTNN